MNAVWFYRFGRLFKVDHLDAARHKVVIARLAALLLADPLWLRSLFRAHWIRGISGQGDESGCWKHFDSFLIDRWRNIRLRWDKLYVVAINTIELRKRLQKLCKNKK